MRAAVIDIGSNTVNLIIGEDVDEKIVILESLKNVVGIGKSTFYKGRISQDIFNEIISILENYKRLIGQYDVKEVRVITTTAVREAENRNIFLDTIKRKTGLDVEVLNVGDVVYYINAFLAYKLKTSYPIHQKNLIIAELGAGSLDVSIMERGFTLMNLGLPIGTLRLKQFRNNIEASQKETYEAMLEHVEQQIMSLKRSFVKIKIDDVILIDESYSKVLKTVLPDEGREANFFKFKEREARQLLEKVTKRSIDDFALQYRLDADIGDTIDGYALIVNNLFRLISGHYIFVMETSLSEALLAQVIFGVKHFKKYNKQNQLISVAKFLCRKFDADLKHSRHLANLCEQLFDQLQEMLGLKEDDRLFLVMAAYLQNIGLFISNRAYHKHSEYIINALSLFRLTDEEIKMIACIARYHRKSFPEKTHPLYNSISDDNQIVIQKLSSLLRMANALDSSNKQKVRRIEVVQKKPQEIILMVTVRDNFVLERVNFKTMKLLFEEVSGSYVNIRVKKEG